MEDGQMDNGHPMITIADLEPMAQVSSKSLNHWLKSTKYL